MQPCCHSEKAKMTEEQEKIEQEQEHSSSSPEQESSDGVMLDAAQDDGTLSTKSKNNKDEPTPTSLNSVSQEIPSKPSEKSAPAKKPQMSEGEKKFNWWVYSGLNYWTNLFISVVLADSFLKKRANGRTLLDPIIESATLGMEKIGVELGNAHRWSRAAVKFLSLLSGGYVLLVPLKILEDNKRNVVHWLNEKLGVDQTAPDGHKETPEEIHIESEQPKQTWGNVIWRRILGTLAVVSSGFALNFLYRDKNTILPDEHINIGGRTIIHQGKPLPGSDRATGQIVGFINKVLKHAPFGLGEKLTRIGGLPNRWLNLVALDSFFTVVTAVVMYITRGAEKGKMPCEIDDSNDPPSHEEKHHIVHDKSDEKARCFSEKFAQGGRRQAIEKRSIAPDDVLANMPQGESIPAMGM